jgi:hypothetical protein
MKWKYTLLAALLAIVIVRESPLSAIDRSIPCTDNLVRGLQKHQVDLSRIAIIGATKDNHAIFVKPVSGDPIMELIHQPGWVPDHLIWIDEAFHGTDKTAGSLVREVIFNELSDHKQHGYWRYWVKRHTAAMETMLKQVETPQGPVSRVVAINGQPVNAEVQHQSFQEYQNDETRIGNILTMLPDAFLYEYDGMCENGDLYVSSSARIPTTRRRPFRLVSFIR